MQADGTIPAGYNVSLGGQSEQQAKAFQNLILALALSVVLEYMLLAALYESMILPFATMFALPLAVIGAFVGLAVTGNTLNLLSMIGVIVLMGLVGKNGILLIDYTNTLRQQGRTRAAGAPRGRRDPPAPDPDDDGRAGGRPDAAGARPGGGLGDVQGHGVGHHRRHAQLDAAEPAGRPLHVHLLRRSPAAGPADLALAAVPVPQEGGAAAGPGPRAADARPSRPSARARAWKRSAAGRSSELRVPSCERALTRNSEHIPAMVPGMERTLVLIKPDGVQRGLVGPILSRFEARGLKIVGLKLMQVPTALAEEHYAEHKGKGFYAGLIDYITSGPVIAMVLEGPNAVGAVRKTVGATRAYEAAAGTIRGDFALETGRNLVHASDEEPGSAEREVKLWFGDDGLMAWSRETDRWIYE